MNLILFIIFLLIICSIFGFNFKLVDIVLNVSDKNINIAENSTVNINNPSGVFNVNTNNLNKVAAAISSAGGATAGFKVAQYIGGPPSTKIAAGLATMIAAQGTTAIMSKVLNNNTVTKTDFIVCRLVSDNNLNEYPLNIISDVNTVLYSSLLFLVVIFNIYVSKYIYNKNYSKYLPDNKLGFYLNKFLTRYINLWNKAGNYLLIFSYIMLSLTVIISKIALTIILDHYK